MTEVLLGYHITCFLYQLLCTALVAHDQQGKQVFILLSSAFSAVLVNLNCFYLNVINTLITKCFAYDNIHHCFYFKYFLQLFMCN